MQIYLMRHAIAADLGDGPWKRDAERPLTKEGIRRTHRAAEGLVSAGVVFDAILSSPLVRARETAGIVAEVLEDATPSTRRGKAPGARGGEEHHGRAHGGDDRAAPAVLLTDALAPGLHLDELYRLVRRAAGLQKARQEPARPAAGGIAGHRTDRSAGTAGKERDAEHEARILLVGHEPDMGWLAAHLLGLPGGHSLPFKKGAIARIDLEQLPPVSPGRLVWMLTAPLAAKLGS